MLKSNQTARLIGPVVLFGALFLPGYIYQDPEAASAILADPGLILQNLVLQLPHVALILYIILTRGHQKDQSAGMVPLKAPDMLKILAGTAGLFVISIPAAFISQKAGGMFSSPVTPDTIPTGGILLLVPFFIVSAYREELFFRSYLLTELAPFGKTAGIAIGSLLFALGHLYQGIGAFVVTAVIGVFLSWLFLRTRNLHVVAFSHGIYNYLVIIAGLSI